MGLIETLQRKTQITACIIWQNKIFLNPKIAIWPNNSSLLEP